MPFANSDGQTKPAKNTSRDELFAEASGPVSSWLGPPALTGIVIALDTQVGLRLVSGKSLQFAKPGADLANLDA